MSTALRKKLESELMDTDFRALAPHFARGALVMVAPELDLLDVAEAVARDQRAQVEAWLSQRLIWRTTDDDARRATSTDQTFQFVIVQPWVLARRTSSQEPVSA